MKKLTASDVGIIVSIVGMIASILVIVIDAIKKESVAVGVGLLLFCSLSLWTNVKNKRNEK